MGATGVTSSGAVLICLVVTILLYNEGCKADVGTPCTVADSTNCTTGEICSSDSCTCDTTHYQNGSICLQKIALSQTCVNSSVVDQCVTSEAVCAADNKCRCNTGTFDSNGFGTADGVCVNMNLLMVTSVGSSNIGANSVTISWAAPATYNSQVSRYEVTWTTLAGGSGSQSGDTSTSLQVTGLQSAIQYSFYVKTIESGSQTTEQQVITTTPLMVTTKSLLGNSCGDCADPNAVCSGTCVCGAGYYDNDGDTSNVGGICTQRLNPGMECTTLPTNACKDNSVCTNNMCTCNAGYYDSDGPSVNSGICTARLNPGMECTTLPTNACKDNSVCTNNVCTCNAGYYDSDGPSVNSGICTAKHALSVSCNSLLTGVSQCSDVNAECTSTGGNLCRCKADYFDSNGYNTAGGTCTSMSVLKVTNVNFTPGTDTVSVTWTPPADTSQVNKYQVIWNPATSNVYTSYDVLKTASSATISGFTSGTTYTFNVKTLESGSRTVAQEIVSNSPVQVSMKAALSVSCGSGQPVVVCEDTTTASCTSNICRCNEGYFDSNGYNTPAGVCTPMSDLKVISVTSSSVTTTGVTISWTESVTPSQVSSFTVVWRLSGSSTVEGTSSVGKVTTKAITGLSQSTTYVFKVISIESGSRSTPQQVESDASVTVITKAELSQPCDAISCGDVNSECITGNSGGNVCRCKSGYYDSNGYNTDGGVCTDMSGLVVTSLEVGVEGTSTVTLKWAAPSIGSDQVNRYEVHWTPALSNGTTYYNAATSTLVRLTGFTSGEMYTFYVKSIEVGSRSLQQEVQTTSVSITVDAGLGVGCNTDGTIKCADSNSECTQTDDSLSTVCRCKESYFDSNGFSTAGGMCIGMSTLAVTDVRVVTEGTDTVNISWTPPSQYTERVNRYEVFWIPTVTISGNTFYNAALATSVQLVGCTPGQTYNFSVRSVEFGSRTVEQSFSVSAATTTMKPATPSAFTETDVDGPEIKLSWTLPSGIRTSYDVITTPSLNPTTTSTEFIIYSTGVIDGQRYNISITTVSGSERSDPLEATFRTVSKTPDPPTAVNCKATTDKTITLAWTAPLLPRGDIQHYVVKSITTSAMFTTTSSLTEYTVDGLQPETPYVFSVATVNDAVTSQSGYSPQAGCPTKAAMSLPPDTVIVSQVQSRQFTLNWTKPTTTNGNLRGYSLTVLEGNTCVRNVIFTCTSCTGYAPFIHTTTCQEADKQSVVIMPADIESFSYTVENLNPYINYTVSVLAVNAAGDGHPNTTNVKTDQEVPQSPTSLTATVVSSTMIYVNWTISGPEPGPTTYSLYVIAESPESSRTETIIGFTTRSHTVLSLQEYRIYTFNLTAATIKGTAAYQQILPSQRTGAAAPGPVGNFRVARPSGLNFTTVMVSWELPSVLERNSDITKFMFSHNSTGGNLDSAPEEIMVTNDMNTAITRNLEVVPQNTYYIEVYAVGTDTSQNVYTGEKSTYNYAAPAGAPPLDVGETVIPSSSNTNIQPTQTSFTLTLTEAFFINTLYGSIADMSLVLCKDSCNNFGDSSEAVSEDYLNNLDGWKDARTTGYANEYRAMSKTDFEAYLVQASTSGRRKRSTKTFVVQIGKATNCDSSTEKYCNGPLEAGSNYYVKGVVCTVGGCTLSSRYGPYTTEKVPDPGPDIGVIVGVVCGIVAFAIVIVIIVVFMKRRQSSKPSTYKTDEEEPDLREIEKKHIPAKRPVVMERFPQHVADLHKDSKLKFAKEYEDLKELSAKHPCNAANEDENKLKNRYVNILPFDHSRVKLNPADPEDPSTDFINANYIPGYNSPREYIASQGPIPGTIDDFWRMIWEQQVAICVMLTLCKEDGRIKCEQYWPTERNEPKQYGDIVVEITSCSTVNTYDFRIFKLTQGDQTRTLKHFHFLNWKDFSANVQNDVMIDFIQNVRAHIQPPDKKGPMIIHCSAGVGRTGTYMALDQLIQFIDEHDFSENIDIFDLVLTMRNYRVFMVQTEQQYVFIHDCARDLIERKRARLQNDDDDDLYVNKAYEEDPEENMYQNQDFYNNTTAKTEL